MTLIEAQAERALWRDEYRKWERYHWLPTRQDLARIKYVRMQIEISQLHVERAMLTMSRGQA